jgi:hypothetical protein
MPRERAFSVSRRRRMKQRLPAQIGLTAFPEV